MSVAIAGIVVSAASTAAGIYGANKSAKVTSSAAKSAATASAEAAERAAKATASATKYAANLQLKQYNQIRSDNKPWLTQGTNAINVLGPEVINGTLNRPFTLNDFEADPGYGFRVSEGVSALDNSAASKGALLSGNQLKAISNYGQNTASAEYQNAYSRFVAQQTQRYNQLSGVSTSGQNAANQIGTAGTAYANSVSDKAISAANTSNGYYSDATNTAINAQFAAANAQSSAYASYGKSIGNFANFLGNYKG